MAHLLAGEDELARQEVAAAYGGSVVGSGSGSDSASSLAEQMSRLREELVQLRQGSSLNNPGFLS